MKKYHIISHTHWDREWYQTYQQFRLRLVHLVDNLLAILEKDPDFKHFMLDGQTIILEDYLEVRPEKEELLKQYIREGRILIGPWHILPDMFLVSPEAHIRNLLQGDQTARKFGPKMPVGYIPDPFGHPGQTPQILKGFGIQAASLWRGLSDQPAELLWEAPDGSQVLLAYLRDSYSNGENLPVQNPELFINKLSLAAESLLAHSASDECLIMLGTDHMEPSGHTSEAIAYADKYLSDVQVLHSTLPAYIKNIQEKLGDIQDSLPVVYGELRACDRSDLLPGVLSARMWIKQRNQQSQSLLEKWAEPFSVFSEIMNGEEPIDLLPNNVLSSTRIRNVAPLLRQAWRYLMQNHPHDSICGCSIDQVHEEMKPRFDQADQISEELTHQSLQTLSRLVNTKKEGAFSALVVYNPHDTHYQDLVEVELNIPETIKDFALVDVNGRITPHQFIEANHEELANILVDKKGLHDTISSVNEGWVAGRAIKNVKITCKESTINVEIVLDDKGQPNLTAWQKGETLIRKYEADPEITHFHILVYSPRSSKIQFVSPELQPFGWEVLWARVVLEKNANSPKEVHPFLKPVLPLALRFTQTEIGEKLLAKLSDRKQTKPPYVIENEFYIVEAHPTDGTFTITDKMNRTIFAGLNRFLDGGDAGDTYNYSPPENDHLFTPKVESIEVLSHQINPAIEVNFLMKVPETLAPDRKSRGKKRISMPIRSRISLIPGVDRIDISTEVENLARDHRLRVHFPVPFIVWEANYDGHFEVVKRQTGIPEKGADWAEDPRPEVPQRAFTDVSNSKVGLMIANRGLPEVEVLNELEGPHTEIALTLLRCVGWLSRGDLPVRQGYAGPDYETPGAQMQGKWTFEYAIIPHEGDWQNAFARAYVYQTNLRAVETGVHDGNLPNVGSFVFHSPEEFVISAIKPAESGTDWILRGTNITDETLKVRIKPLLNFSSAYRVNLAEEIIENLEIKGDESITLPVAGHEIASILFKR